MNDDPVSQFFPNEDDVDLYEVLSVKKDATPDEIKKAYRRLALIHHPDKHANVTVAAKADASTKFQQLSFAYTVLGDPKRKERYDKTGRTDEYFELAGEDGWETYFEAMFERVTRGKLEEMKKEYQGSSEELNDLKAAYMNTGGVIGDIMTQIPHSTHEDESRFIVIISDLIQRGKLPALDQWYAAVGDEKAKLVRKKQAQKEAQEAECLAKELGVWDEFYGGGSKEDRKGKRRGRNDAEDQDHSVLQALITTKQKNMDSFFDNLASKYTESGHRSKGKKRIRDETESPRDTTCNKRARDTHPSMPEINDEEFAKLQAKLFRDKTKEKFPARSSKPAQVKKGKGR